MKVGSLEETINVSGTAPQVDVQQASRTTVIARDVIDSLPISRNVMGLGVLAAGVRPNTPDMGGMQTTEQVGLRARGLGGFDGEQQVEGMSVQSYEGGSQSFVDDTLNAEMTVTTSSIPADTGGGGIRLNMILKDGGNQFSGSAFMGGTRGIWVADNIDQRLRDRNLDGAERHRSSRGVHRVARRSDSCGTSCGGSSRPAISRPRRRSRTCRSTSRRRRARR